MCVLRSLFMSFVLYFVRSFSSLLFISIFIYLFRDVVIYCVIRSFVLFLFLQVFIYVLRSVL